MMFELRGGGYFVKIREVLRPDLSAPPPGFRKQDY